MSTLVTNAPRPIAIVASAATSPDGYDPEPLLLVGSGPLAFAAAHVDPTTGTVAEVVAALVAAGLMKAS
jgi:hypothetical protein